MPDREPWAPALLRNGNGPTNAVAEFIEDAKGDLTDILYYCEDCAKQVIQEDYNGVQPLWWPAYEWPEYTVVCRCGVMLNQGDDDGI